MIYALRFLPEVEADVIEGYAWYEERSPGLGEDFLRLFYAYAAEIPRNPLLYTKVHGDFRRRLLRRFPYAIYFKVEPGEVTIFGLFHCARDPGTIGGYLRDREGPESSGED